MKILVDINLGIFICWWEESQELIFSGAGAARSSTADHPVFSQPNIYTKWLKITLNIYPNRVLFFKALISWLLSWIKFFQVQYVKEGALPGSKLIFMCHPTLPRQVTSMPNPSLAHHSRAFRYLHVRTGHGSVYCHTQWRNGDFYRCFSARMSTLNISDNF